MGRRARGALESAVMGVLWAADGSCTPAQVQAEIGGDLAYNTVQTILIRLLEKGQVTRHPQGRGYAYRPAQDGAVVAAQRMRATLADRPDRQAVLLHFAVGLDDTDVAALRAFLADRRTEPWA
jgi:predicted transcriptional regulator